MSSDAAGILDHDVASIISNLEITVRKCEPLARDRPELVTHYRVDADEGKYFLKVRRPSGSRLKALSRKLIGNPSLERQVAVHEALEHQCFRTLRFPRLIESDRQHYLLMEYVPAMKVGSSGRADPDQVIDALFEFQHSDGQLRRDGVGSRLLDLILNPMWFTAATVITKLTKQCGVATTLRCLRVLLRCRLEQSPQPVTLFVHNDFHPENVLSDPNGRLYLTDFENVTRTRLWYLIDIVHYAVGTTQAVIDTSLVSRYMTKLQREGSTDGSVQWKSQLRAGLLRRIVQQVTSTVPPSGVRDTYTAFLTQTLLPDLAYEDWYAKNLS